MDEFESTLLYSGTYQADYPRNRMMIEAFNRSGFSVLELNEPVWDVASSKRENAGGWFGWSVARLAAGCCTAYPKLIFRVARQLRRSQALVIGYPGQLDVLILGPLAKVWRKPVIFNPLVTLTDMVVEDRGLVSANSVLGRRIRFVDRLAFQLSDLVIVDTAENGVYVEQRFQVSPAKIVVIPVGADSSIFDPTRHPKPVHSPQRPLRVLFYGKYIPLHGIDTILQAAKVMQDMNALVEIELIGNGQTYAAMRTMADELSLSNVHFIDPVSYAELPEQIAAADVVLGIFGETPKASRVIPNKVYQAMAMGSAIVTRRSSAVEGVLRDRESALLVEPGSPEELTEAILALRDERLRAELGRAARCAYEAFAGPEVLAEQAGRAIRALLHVKEMFEQPLRVGSVK